MQTSTASVGLFGTDEAPRHANGAAHNGASGHSKISRAATILLEEQIRVDQELLRNLLGEEPHRLLFARDTAEIFAALDSGLVDLVVLSSGGAFDSLECCRKIKANRKTELVPVLMITDDEIRAQIEALSAGADDFLCRPAHPELARTQLRALLRQKAATDRLEHAETVLFALAEAVEQRDLSTGSHCERLSLFSLVMGLELGLPDEDLQALYRGGMLHDIGKVAVPDHILLKSGPLTESEWATMCTHTIRGEAICRPLRSLSKVLPIIRSHHEKWNGTGYPDGLKGGQIPLLARILQLSDIYDALTNVRPYKQALPPETALEIMQRETEQGWRDPELMGVFLHLHHEAKNKTTWRDAEEMQRSLRNLQQHLRNLA